MTGQYRLLDVVPGAYRLTVDHVLNLSSGELAHGVGDGDVGTSAGGFLGYNMGGQ